VAFAASSHIRHRDIWDLRWITRNPGIDYHNLRELVEQKIIDYGAEKVFADGLARVTEKMPALVEDAEFLNQMKRFLPIDVLEQTLERDLFREHLAQEIQNLYRKTGFITAHTV